MSTQVSPSVLRLPAAAPALPATEAPDPCLALLDQQTPSATRRYLIRAVRCTEFIERRRRTFAPGNPGDRLVSGLQRKLFLDDYGDTALATGQVKAARAAEVGKLLMTNLQQTAEVPNAVASGERLPLEGALAERMSKSYEMMLAGPNESYSNVWDVVGNFDPGGQSTDSFKDALCCVALRSELKGWLETEEQQRAETITALSAKWLDPQFAATASASRNEVSRDQVAELVQVQAAYHDVFAFRYLDRQGLEALPMLIQLDRITVAGIGPELVVPSP